MGAQTLLTEATGLVSPRGDQILEPWGAALTTQLRAKPLKKERAWATCFPKLLMYCKKDQSRVSKTAKV